jgi:ankyrin repeat protein
LNQPPELNILQVKGPNKIILQLNKSLIKATFALILLTSCFKGDKKDGIEKKKNDTASNSLLANKKITISSDSLEKQRKTLQLDSLIAAIRNGDTVIVEQLIARGVDVNGKVFHARHYWDSPLSQALLRDNNKIVKVLVKNGADPNLELGENLTPFHQSAGGSSSSSDVDSFQTFKMLLENGGEVNTFNNYHHVSVLMTAIRNNDTRYAITLMEHGAIIESDSVNAFQPPLSIAVSGLQYEISEALIKRGANINAQFSKGYEDCMICPEKITVVHELVTMLQYMDKKMVEKMLNLILLYKPDLNIENGFGHTALEFAMLGSDPAIVDKLVRHGAKLETQNSSALHLAAQISNSKMVEYLLKKHNVNVNFKDEKGNTPLKLCLDCCGGGFGEGITEEARLKTIEVLLNYGADPKLKNNSGESFIEHAKRGWYKSITNLLVTRGLLKKDEVQN